MLKVKNVADAVNCRTIKSKNVIYAAGNAATPQVLLGQLAVDKSITNVDLFCILPLGNKLKQLFSKERCKEITHRVIFNSELTRKAVNEGWAKYHPMHLSEVPRYIGMGRGVNVVFISVAGPDNGGNYSLGTTVEALPSAINSAKKSGGIIIAERNAKMPFVPGTTIPESTIDYMIDTDYPLPISPIRQPDETAKKIGEIIAALYIKDGSGKKPGSTIQYGIGEVPEAVTDAILRKGVRDLAIHTELFSGAMRRLVQNGAVTNKWKKDINFSISSIFLAENQAGYEWLHYNSSVQSRPSDYTNSIFEIAHQPNMVTINSAIGVDLHGNIWADSLDARHIYSGVGGQSDFIRGAQYSPGGLAIIAFKSTTKKGVSKIVDKSPGGITTTATPSDRVILVTEQGAFDPARLSLGERAVGIAHLAAPEVREQLLKKIDDDPSFHKPFYLGNRNIRGFIPYERIIDKH